MMFLLSLVGGTKSRFQGLGAGVWLLFCRFCIVEVINLNLGRDGNFVPTMGGSGSANPKFFSKINFAFDLFINVMKNAKN